MLRILALIFAVSLLLGPAFVRADFFEEKNTVAQEIGCGECESEAGSLNTDLKGKVVAIEKAVSRNLNKKRIITITGLPYSLTLTVVFAMRRLRVWLNSKRTILAGESKVLF